ncbi:MAG: hypothetical protein ACHQ4H_07765 [Ktedonobacterales bacterium]
MDDFDRGFAHDEDELDVEEAFFGAHAIEYWIVRDRRLVPASPAERACILRWERERIAHAVSASGDVAVRHVLPIAARMRMWLARVCRALRPPDRARDRDDMPPSKRSPGVAHGDAPGAARPRAEAGLRAP